MLPTVVMPQWIVTPKSQEKNVGKFVAINADVSWNQVKRWIAAGKVFIDGTVCQNPGLALKVGSEIEVKLHAPSGRDTGRVLKIAYEDAHLVVIDKPVGISTVPYAQEKDTAMDALRNTWKKNGENWRQPIFVVHRIDKPTSGLVMFAKTKKAELGLATQLREHSMSRHYVCVAHGGVTEQKVETWIMRDRGDGLRGASLKGHRGGKLAVSNISVVKRKKSCSRCHVTLETGRTHQIRIHLSELGHPLVGDKVYNRDFWRKQKPLLTSSRLLLHAASLGFEHPVSKKQILLDLPPPQEFETIWKGLP